MPRTKKDYSTVVFTDRAQLRSMMRPKKVAAPTPIDGTPYYVNAICGITGKEYMTTTYDQKTNVYGHVMYVQRTQEFREEYVWLKCIETYVRRNDERFRDRIINVRAFNFLRENTEKLLKTGDLVTTADTDNIIAKSRANYVDDTEEYYEHTYGLAYVQDLDKWVTEEYANDCYFYHGDGEWYSYEEEDSDGDNDCLQSYDKDPADTYGFFTDKGNTVTPLPKTLYFGLEVELEYDDYSYGDVGKTVHIANQHSFCACSDGSLDEGFELKSSPMTFERVKKSIKGVLASLSEEISFSAESTCGVHIHVSRGALTDLQIGVIQEFLYASKSYDFINFVAGRRPNDYCIRNGDAYNKTGRLRACSEYNPQKQDYIIKYKHIAGDEGRYESLNTGNDNTVEFRIFAGTSDVERIHSYIEFVKALTEITSDAHREKVLTVDGMMRYIRKYRKQFPNLFARIKTYAERQGKKEIVDITTRMPRRIKGARQAA